MSQRPFRMRPKSYAKREPVEQERPTQNQQEPERYLLQIDRQTKRSFNTPEAARCAALEIKARFPALQPSFTTA
jgi:hypothetical protein